MKRPKIEDFKKITSSPLIGYEMYSKALESYIDHLEQQNEKIKITGKCKCIHCINYEFYKWAIVMECKCGCHKGNGMTGHDGLCCSLPNGLKKNNPHKKLKEAKYYRKILDKWENECEI